MFSKHGYNAIESNKMPHGSSKHIYLSQSCIFCCSIMIQVYSCHVNAIKYDSIEILTFVPILLTPLIRVSNTEIVTWQKSRRRPPATAGNMRLLPSSTLMLTHCITRVSASSASCPAIRAFHLRERYSGGSDTLSTLQAALLTCTRFVTSRHVLTWQPKSARNISFAGRRFAIVQVGNINVMSQ